jgi:hypothetical protein
LKFFRTAAALLLFVLTVERCTRSRQSGSTLATPAPFLELRLAYDDSVAGRERFEHRDSTIFLAQPALLSDDDLIAVRPVMRADGLILDVRYRADAGERLATVLAQHIGGKAALLIGSRVRNVVFIASPVGASGQLSISTDVTGAEAEQMTEYVRARWPAPRPE